MRGVAAPGISLRVRPLRILAAVAVIAGLGYAFRGRLLRLVMPPEPPPADTRGVALAAVPPQDVTTVATDLDTPWAIAFLPDRSLLVTERPGRLVHLVNDAPQAAVTVPGVHETAEGGLLGLALHPRFEQNRWLYLMLTTDGPSGLENRVMRYRWTDSGLEQPKVIIDGIHAAMFHDGGRIAFGPDGYLYVTTGDATDAAQAQERASLNGKILRVTDEGGLPPDNPFGTRVYSWGNRNPEGLTWDERGRLWSTEHGRSGTGSGLDELNLIEPGNNYGWPLIQGDETRAGMVAPVLHSGPDYTWAPAGAAFWDGSVFFGGLRGEALYEARVAGEAGPTLRVHFYGDLGRIRAVTMGPDSMLYLSTSNHDGRGRVRAGDDKILRIDPRVFRP